MSTVGGALAACTGNASGDTQLAAKVGASEISIHQVEVALRRQPSLASSPSNEAAKLVLDGLVEQEIAAQAAVKTGLDHEPNVVQALELAKREVLARALQDGVVARVEMPPTADIDKFYSDQPALFAERRIYTLQEFVVEAPTSALADLQQMAKASRNAEGVATALNRAGLPFRSRVVPKAPEDLDFAAVEAMASLSEGQTLVLPQTTGAVMYTVLRFDAAPMDRVSAGPAIASYLLGQRRREALVQRMKALRDATKVEYVGMFAAAAPPSASSSAAAK